MMFSTKITIISKIQFLFSQAASNAPLRSDLIGYFPSTVECTTANYTFKLPARCGHTFAMVFLWYNESIFRLISYVPRVVGLQANRIIYNMEFDLYVLYRIKGGIWATRLRSSLELHSHICSNLG